MIHTLQSFSRGPRPRRQECTWSVGTIDRATTQLQPHENCTPNISWRLWRHGVLPGAGLGTQVDDPSQAGCHYCTQDRPAATQSDILHTPSASRTHSSLCRQRAGHVSTTECAPRHCHVRSTASYALCEHWMLQRKILF